MTVLKGLWEDDFHNYFQAWQRKIEMCEGKNFGGDQIH